MRFSDPARGVGGDIEDNRPPASDFNPGFRFLNFTTGDEQVVVRNTGTPADIGRNSSNYWRTVQMISASARSTVLINVSTNPSLTPEVLEQIAQICNQHAREELQPVWPDAYLWRVVVLTLAQFQALPPALAKKSCPHYLTDSVPLLTGYNSIGYHYLSTTGDFQDLSGGLYPYVPGRPWMATQVRLQNPVPFLDVYLEPFDLTFLPPPFFPVFPSIASIAMVETREMNLNPNANLLAQMPTYFNCCPQNLFGQATKEGEPTLTFEGNIEVNDPMELEFYGKSYQTSYGEIFCFLVDLAASGWFSLQKQLFITTAGAVGIPPEPDEKFDVLGVCAQPWEFLQPGGGLGGWLLSTTQAGFVNPPGVFRSVFYSPPACDPEPIGACTIDPPDPDAPFVRVSSLPPFYPTSNGPYPVYFGIRSPLTSGIQSVSFPLVSDQKVGRPWQVNREKNRVRLERLDNPTLGKLSSNQDKNKLIACIEKARKLEIVPACGLPKGYSIPVRPENRDTLRERLPVSMKDKLFETPLADHLIAASVQRLGIKYKVPDLKPEDLARFARR